MDLNGKKVIHKRYGEGTIVSEDNGHIEVAFASDAAKLFVYPDAFLSFLTFQEEDLQVQVSAELKEKRITERELIRRNSDTFMQEQQIKTEKKLAEKPVKKASRSKHPDTSE